jgi:tryptophanyl-tRNA synthetase
VEGNPVFIYHDAFNQDISEVDELKERYRKGKVGDVEVKKKLITALETFLEPIRVRREAFANRPKQILDILHAGSTRMEDEAQETLELVRKAMGLESYLRQKSRFKVETEKVLEGLAFL